ncbi:unknown [Brachyspira sp. CAG:484]|nr:unknown [Brachyspira sp. CAG:484]
MKKILLLVCLTTFAAPAFSQEGTNMEAVKYMNQSQSFPGFSRSLPTTQNQEAFEKPVQVKKTTEKQYDYNGFEIEEVDLEPPVKKVIKTRSDNNGAVTQNAEKTAPMTYDNFPKFYDNNNMMQNSMQGIMPGMMTPGMF